MTPIEPLPPNGASHLGIDFGAKTAGTTAICYAYETTLFVLQSAKKEDADRWLKKQIALLQPKQIFIDAPLSVPSAVKTESGGDFFYRECDRALNAMSPMFIGGLTARAMRLAHEWRNDKIAVFETYPKALLELGPLDMHIAPYSLPETTSRHQLDAVAAWASGSRMMHKKEKQVGDPREGLIIY